MSHLIFVLFLDFDHFGHDLLDDALFNDLHKCIECVRVCVCVCRMYAYVREYEHTRILRKTSSSQAAHHLAQVTYAYLCILCISVWRNFAHAFRTNGVSFC
jgi:hypothetical protein